MTKIAQFSKQFDTYSSTYGINITSIKAVCVKEGLHFVTKHFKNIKKQSQHLKLTSKYVNLLLVTTQSADEDSIIDDVTYSCYTLSKLEYDLKDTWF